MFIQGEKTGHISFKLKSMQAEHKEVKTAKKGSRVGIKVPEEVRAKDKIFITKSKN